MLDSYKADNFPLDVAYFDIPYMDKYADFTVDPVTFPNAGKFTEDLHEQN